jgi:hypothetical protein
MIQTTNQIKMAKGDWSQPHDSALRYHTINIKYQMILPWLKKWSPRGADKVGTSSML